MPRLVALDAPGILHHVMGRGEGYRTKKDNHLNLLQAGVVKDIIGLSQPKPMVRSFGFNG